MKIYTGFDTGPSSRDDTVQIGDTVLRKPVTFLDKDIDDAGFLPGRVVWIHPQGRYHTVEFGAGDQTVRESFMGIKR